MKTLLLKALIVFWGSEVAAIWVYIIDQWIHISHLHSLLYVVLFLHLESVLLVLANFDDFVAQNRSKVRP